MILNVTNSKVVMGFSGGGRDTDTWKNIPVAIYADPKVRFGKDTVEGLRIRPVQPRTTETPKPKLSPDLIVNSGISSTVTPLYVFCKFERVIMVLRILVLDILQFYSVFRKPSASAYFLLLNCFTQIVISCLRNTIPRSPKNVKTNKATFIELIMVIP